MEEERIELSARERERLKVLHEVEQGHLRPIAGPPRAIPRSCAEGWNPRGGDAPL
jgi:hypothetical protein